MSEKKKAMFKHIIMKSQNTKEEEILKADWKRVNKREWIDNLTKKQDEEIGAIALIVWYS